MYQHQPEFLPRNFKSYIPVVFLYRRDLFCIILLTYLYDCTYYLLEMICECEELTANSENTKIRHDASIASTCYFQSFERNNKSSRI